VFKRYSQAKLNMMRDPSPGSTARPMSMDDSRNAGTKLMPVRAFLEYLTFDRSHSFRRSGLGVAGGFRGQSLRPSLSDNSQETLYDQLVSHLSHELGAKHPGRNEAQCCRPASRIEPEAVSRAQIARSIGPRTAPREYLFAVAVIRQLPDMPARSWIPSGSLLRETAPQA